MNLSPDATRALLELARSAIRAAVLGEPAAPPNQDESLQLRAGCFVSLHDLRTHRLRGCVGRMESDEPLAALVPQMAAACLRDPRFEGLRVQPADLPGIELEVTLLSPLRPAAQILVFDLHNEGIFLQIDQRSGCFLPQVARETGWSRQQLLSRLCTEKLDLPHDAWQRSDARLHTFTTLILGPVPFVQA